MEIAKRKKATETIRISEERLKILFESAPDAYYLSDIKGNFLDGNKAAEKLIGYKKEELIGKNILSLGLISNNQLGKTTKSIANSLLGKKSGPDEFILNHKNGSKIYVEISNFPVTIGDETVVLGIARDLTKRKEAEKELRQSEEKYRLITTNTLDTIWTTDKEIKMTFVNDAIFNFLGYTPEEFIGLIPSVFTPAEGLLAIENAVKKLVANYEKGEIKQAKFELQQIKKDGTLIDVEITANLLLDNNGEFIGFQGRSIDISERKKSEKALTEFNDIINRSPSVVFLWRNEKNWPVEFVSKNVEKLTGYTYQEFLEEKVTYRQIIYDDDLTNIENEIALFLKQENSQIIQHKNYRIITKNGDIKWIEDKTLIRRNSNGDIEYYEGIVSDITHRKKNEEQLSKLSAAVTQSPSVIAITDLKGQLEYVNPKFTEITGYTFDEAKGENPRTLNSGMQSKDIYKDLWKTISAGKEWHGEFLNKKKNGDLFWEAASISAIFNKQGEIINYLKVAEDITVRKKAEEKLERSEEQLRGLTKYMDAKFEEEKKRIGKEIHDGIGQLLTGLKMDLKWITKKMPKEITELNSKFKSMNNIIDIGVKEVQKLSVELRPKMLDELGLLETIKTEVEKFEERTEISCNLQFKPDTFEVESDRSSTIYRILMELLTNIYRYAEANKIEIKFEMKDEGYLFTVFDNGIGITKDQIEDKSSFGLMTISERVNKWNGSFTISGEHKKGTSVEITIPFN